MTYYLSKIDTDYIIPLKVKNKQTKKETYLISIIVLSCEEKEAVITGRFL